MILQLTSVITHQLGVRVFPAIWMNGDGNANAISAMYQAAAFGGTKTLHILYLLSSSLQLAAAALYPSTNNTPLLRDTSTLVSSVTHSTTDIICLLSGNISTVKVELPSPSPSASHPGTPSPPSTSHPTSTPQPTNPPPSTSSHSLSPSTLLTQMNSLGPTDRCTPSQAQAMGRQVLAVIALHEKNTLQLPRESDSVAAIELQRNLYIVDILGRITLSLIERLSSFWRHWKVSFIRSECPLFSVHAAVMFPR